MDVWKIDQNDNALLNINDKNWVQNQIEIVSD